MKSNERFLAPLELDHSAWESVVLTLGQTPREVIRAIEARESHSISFELKAGVLRQSQVQFSLWASTAATVKLYIDDQFVDSFEYSDGQTPPGIQTITTELTNWVEKKKSSTLRLLISYHGQKGQVFLAADRDWPGFEPKMILKSSPSYFFASATFLSLSWLAVLGIAVIVLARIQILGDSFRFYAVLTTILLWLAGLMGLSDLANVPVQSGMRYLWSKTRSHENSLTRAGTPRHPLMKRFMRWRRAIALTMLFLLSVPALFFAGRIISGMVIRNYYTSLLNRAVEGSNQDENIRRAFVLVPWRKEAQILFERRAWSLRDPADENQAFKKYVRAFVYSQDVRSAVAAIQRDKGYPFFLRAENSSALNDPVLWYASLLPEAELPGETKAKTEAIHYLSAADEKKNPDAKIQEVSLSMELRQGDVDKTEYLISMAKLRDLLESYTSYKSVTASFPYQVGCDILAQHYITNNDAAEANKWFRRVIEARKRQRTLTSDPIWHRPPEKLMLYYMFVNDVPLAGTEETLKRARKLRDYCAPFKDGFEKEFLKPYEDYKKPETWRVNTALDDKVITYLKDILLNKGWKY
jgi:hypothetical protein